MTKSQAAQQYLADVAPAAAALTLFNAQAQSWDISTTDDEAEAAAQPFLSALQTADDQFLSLAQAYPAAKTDVRSLVAADDGVITDLGQLNTLNFLNLGTWQQQMMQDVGEMHAAVSFVRSDLGLPPNESSTSTDTASTDTTTATQDTATAASASPRCNVGDCVAEAAKGGTLVQCADGNYSNAGGLQGACSGHGGEASGSASTDTTPTTDTTTPDSGTQYSDGQACGTAGNGKTETYRAAEEQCYWGVGTFHAEDYNTHDKSASQCAGMEIGTQSDCYVATQLVKDQAQGAAGGTSWSDTVTEGNDTIHFDCWEIGQDLSGGAEPGIYLCSSQTDGLDWVEWEFT